MRYKPSLDLKNSQVEALFRGSVDMHVHVAPDPAWDRRLNTLETLHYTAEGGMRAFVSKSFYYPTTTECMIANQVIEGATAFGSITIGYGTTGGLEKAPEIIRNHAKIGLKVVWFPAFDAKYHTEGRGLQGGIWILNEDGSLKSEAKEILEIAKEYNLVVCKGHMSFEETRALFAEGKKMGLTKMVCTHPLSDTWGMFTMDQIREIADLGAYTEIVFNMMMPRLGSMDPSDYVDLVHELGAERMILGTDLAQCMDPTPAEGMRFFIGTLLQFGCTEEEIEWMAKTNPYKLLDIKA